jgi:hypothetical protein
MLLEKLNELSAKDGKNGIDIDLMLDYTRVLYADLLEQRKQTSDPKPAIPDFIQKTEPQGNIANSPVFETKTHFTISQDKKDIHSYIGINDKYQFISELFLNKKDLYETALQEISKFDTYHQAYIWLQRHYNWEDDNTTVNSFYNSLNSFFNQK